MDVFTGICITIGCVMLAIFLAAMGEEINEREELERKAREERYRRFKEAHADILMAQAKRDDTFDRAVWFDRIDDLREAQ